MTNRLGYASSAIGSVGMLIVIILITAVAAAILVYMKYGISEDDLNREEQWSWQRFFHFDTLLIAGILRFFYILSAALVAALGIIILVVMTVSAGSGGIVAGFGGFMLGLLVGALTAVLLELLCRVTFEQMMLLIKIAENTTALRMGMGASTLAASASTLQPVAPRPAKVQAPAQEPAARSDAAVEGWTCMSCGSQNGAGNFCHVCGAKRQ